MTDLLIFSVIAAEDQVQKGKRLADVVLSAVHLSSVDQERGETPAMLTPSYALYILYRFVHTCTVCVLCTKVAIEKLHMYVCVIQDFYMYICTYMFVPYCIFCTVLYVIYCSLCTVCTVHMFTCGRNSFLSDCKCLLTRTVKLVSRHKFPFELVYP